MEEKFIINGGRPLRGEIEVRGAKNAAFPILAATLLTKKECVIENVPLIEDVFRMLEILKGMGSEISWVGQRIIKIKNSQVDPTNLREDIIKRLRGSVLFQQFFSRGHYWPDLARCNFPLRAAALSEPGP
ncbi:MAG: hypothetical protein HYW69_01040 [Candidatus Nealsonbacteria bacterium]|nr:hypothetical protein [Candidatus Nealsonbacteria bacterium]